MLGHLSSPLVESEGQGHLLFFQSKVLADGASVSTAIQRHGSREGFSTPKVILSPSPSSGAGVMKGGMDSCFIHSHILRAGYNLSQGCNRRVILPLLRLSGTENTQVGNCSLKLLVQSPRATFPNYHWLPNNRKK